MKRMALLLMLLPFLALSQTFQKVNNANSKVAPVKQVNEQILLDKNYMTKAEITPKLGTGVNRSATRSAKYGITNLGKSQYGLQTNAAVGRRIIVYPDGKMSAVWTTCPDETPFTRRGTGYNHYDGTSWISPAVELRVETDRSGWPNIGSVKVGGTDVEYVVSHYSSSVATDPSGGILLNINTGIGQASWTQTFLDKASGPIWHRTAETGDYVCIISSYSDTNKYINGLRMPTVYSRYQVSTGTFLQKYVMLPGYDTVLAKRGSADDYAMDAKDSVVAIVMAPTYGHVVLWKSTDYGATFKRIMVDSLIVPKPKFVGDTNWFDYSDGSVSVIVDKQGYCKVAWSYYGGFRFSPAIDTTYYQKLKHGIRFWNEKTNTIVNIPTAKVWDRNANGVVDAENGWNYTRTVGGVKYYITGYGSTNDLLTFPQITIDKNDNIFVIYSAIIEKAYLSIGIDGVGDTIKENLRDVYVVYSKDQGVTWGKLQNLTNNPAMEDVFASVAKNCYGDKLHLIYQEDEDPGTDVQNGDDPTENNIYYMEIPISDILNDLIGPGDTNNVNAIAEQPRTFEIGGNYPNPFSGETFIDIKLNNSSNVVITLNNVLGQQVLSNSYSNVAAGKRTLSIDGSNLQSGIYFLNVKVGNETKTIKTMIQ